MTGLSEPSVIASSGPFVVPALDLSTLGAVRIAVPGCPGDEHVLGPQRAALITYLALAPPPGVVRRDTLLGLFWPERDERHARGALRQALHELRGLVGPEVIRAEGRDGVSLDDTRLRCDAAEFERALDREELDRALDLYRGDFLPGLHVHGSVELEHWIEAQRARLRRRALEASLQLTDTLAREGRLQDGARRARAAVALAPGDEAPVRRLMRILLELGERAAAVDAYRAYARRLADVYGMKPSAEMGALLGAARQDRVRRCVAVLPFESLSTDREDECFADGLTEDVVTQVAKIHSLRVIARTSVMPFKHGDRSLRQIGAALGVGTVLEGSVRRAGDRLRIVAELVDVDSGAHLWADTYDRRLTDVLTIQSDVARRISAALEAGISSTERTSIRKAPTADLEAYHLYLKARHSVLRYTSEGLARGIAFYREAIRRDPDCALAHVGLGQAWLISAMGYDGGATRPDDACQGARQAALRALDLDDELGEAHGLLAWLRFEFEFDWTGAEEEVRRAFALSPGDDFSRAVAGLMLSALQRWDEAIAMQRRARDLDPLTAVHSSDVATALLRAGRIGESMAEASGLVELYPEFPLAHSVLGWAYLLDGAPDHGLTELKRAVALAPRNAMLLAQLGQAHAMAGDVDEACRILDRLKGLARRRYVSPYHLAYVYTGLGQREEAMDCLERAYDEHAGGLYDVKGSFLFRSLHDHPRFVRLMGRMRLQ